jgi:hypothetical protein
MGLTTALLEDVRSVIEIGLYDSSNWRFGGNAGGIAPKLFSTILSRKKGGLIYMPSPLLIKPPHFLFPFIRHLPGTTEAAAATAPIAGDEVLPHPRLVVSRPRRLNLTLSLNAPPTWIIPSTTQSHQRNPNHNRRRRVAPSRTRFEFTPPPIPLSHVHFCAHPPPFVPRPNPKLICRFRW